MVVKNRGIDGDTTEGVLKRLNAYLIVPPKKVFIMLGINDIGNGVCAEIFQENYNDIIQTISESCPETEIYIQSILPVNHSIMSSNKRNSRRTSKNISEYNNILHQIAERSGDSVKYIDIGGQLMSRDGELNAMYTFDGVHLNGEGYVRWMDIVKEYVVENE